MFNTTEIKDVKKDIGLLIKQMRKQRKITQIEMAELLDVSKNTIQNLESGKNFTIDTLFKILKEFDVLSEVHSSILAYKKTITETKSLY